MDPRKSKHFSSSSRGGARGGGRIRPRVQSQPAPYVPATTQQPQYYRPAMTSPAMTSPPYYHQPQYYQATNPSHYGAEFNPFEYREAPPRREPSVERQLPLYEDEDYDFAIPETQPSQIGGQENEEDQEVEEVEVQRRRMPNRSERKAWTPGEEVSLAQAWVQISTCKVVGNEQSREGFWRRILEHFKTNIRDTTRTTHGLNTKWRTLHAEMGVFNGLWIQQNRLRESGCSDIDIMTNALADYQTKHDKAFGHIDAWQVVRKESKWLEQPDIAQGSSSHSDKRRKSAESGYYETASNDDVVIPDLNDDTMPRIQKRKGKKVETDTSSKGSVHMSFEDYTSKKKEILEKRAEFKCKKDEMTEKMMESKIRSIEQKTRLRALKAFQSPHDHITDPNILEVTLAEKRELAEKYGWRCDF